MKGLSFTVTDTVWLKKEHRSLVSITLEPYVSTTERDEDYQIHGKLLIEGEVRQTNSEHDYIKHEFPIDVSIPKERANEEVTLYVEGFDYDLQEDGRLTIEADLVIAGAEEPEVTHAIIEVTDLPSFQFEDTLPAVVVQEDQEETMEEEEREPYLELDEDEDEPSEVEDYEEQEEERYQDEEREQEEFASFEEVESAPEPTYEYVEEEPIEEEEVEPVRNTQETNLHEARAREFQQLHVPQEVVEVEPVREEAVDALEPEPAQEKKGASVYLTSMMRNEEEASASMRICIVQEGDTLHSIASHYELTTTQLMRTNRLTDEKVEPGQLISIPR
ncbi:LysM peptidoglycan-binding domain-containing protein [Paenalkalicoccus suaedae]|uniref:LysM peptidoglycan-binding domain-containing protein n=1 Tax=Paenalkalicoccus suaedae TaxID=2592382 RepID=A0A859FEU8_9BACI|nr:LysM peptidoglycan-binding domain-containing protein [Paenalkalicoccus suaedae]QKS71873.1 LysM peptidoglycan-binding domain-containing protein [Paenalkalicoccus suaedae]